MRLSIIIPAYNEEKYLPGLLKSIINQNYPCEIIVADAESTDATAMVSRAFGCRVVQARKGSPALARNAGALAASGDLFVFLDADIILPKNFLRDNISEFYRKKLDLAGVHLKSYGNKIFDWLIIDVFANMWISLMKHFSPDMFGACIFVRREVHMEMNGFNGALYFGEDLDYAKRSSLLGKRFGILGRKAFVSMRRFDKKGRISTTLDYLALHVKRFFVKVTDEKRYTYGGY